MLQQNIENLDALILEEKKRVALEFFNEAWASAIDEGIEPHILAESAVSTALTKLTESEGEQHAETLVEALPGQLECGKFNPNISLQ